MLEAVKCAEARRHRSQRGEPLECFLRHVARHKDCQGAIVSRRTPLRFRDFVERTLRVPGGIEHRACRRANVHDGAACYGFAMFEWWRERRREKILEQPFPDAMLAVLERNVKHYPLLTPTEQKHLRDLVQVFVAEKSWEGCGGLTLTDEMKVTIAAQACLLVLALPHRLFENVESILVYPSTVLRPAETPGVFVQARELIVGEPTALFGEAHQRGPVVLAWDRVLWDGRRPHDGHNLVYHEFAHKLDMLDGDADGTPPLASSEERERWRVVCERAFLALRKRVRRGGHGVIDDYGATNEAEFFAVVTEHFFDRPTELQQAEPELYDLLREFYRQDPAARAAR
jgi:MtfA peptidase